MTLIQTTSEWFCWLGSVSDTDGVKFNSFFRSIILKFILCGRLSGPGSVTVILAVRMLRQKWKVHGKSLHTISGAFFIADALQGLVKFSHLKLCPRCRNSRHKPSYYPFSLFRKCCIFRNNFFQENYEPIQP